MSRGLDIPLSLMVVKRHITRNGDVRVVSFHRWCDPGPEDHTIWVGIARCDAVSELQIRWSMGGLVALGETSTFDDVQVNSHAGMIDGRTAVVEIIAVAGQCPCGHGQYREPGIDMHHLALLMPVGVLGVVLNSFPLLATRSAFYTGCQHPST